MSRDASVYSEAHTLIARGQAKAAEARLRPLLKGGMSDYPALELLAYARSAQGDAKGAIAYLDQAIACNPVNPNAHFNKGIVLFQSGAFEAAALALQCALERDANNLQAWLARGDALSKLKRWDEALTCYQAVVERDPKHAYAHNARGAMLGRLERHQDALEAFELVLAKTPNEPGALYNKGRSLAALMRFDEALAAYDAAVRLRPKDINIWTNRGVALEGLGRREDAIQSYQKAVAVAREIGADDSAALFNHCTLLLASGDYANGFSLYGRRYAMIAKDEAAPLPDVPLWGGEPCFGALRVWAEQGVGDQILFSRLIGLLTARAPNLSWECDPRLVEMMQGVYPELEIRAQKNPRRDVSAQICMSDLPALLKLARPEDIPAAPVWTADAARVGALREHYESLAQGRPIVGIAWASKASNGKFKGAPLSEWGALLLRDYFFISLQYGDSSADVAAAQAMFGREIHIDSTIDQLKDMDSFFAQIAALDHVVTISNTTAHVAGALAKPAYLAAPPGRGLHWYWGEAGETTAWHPSLRIMRRAIDESWAQQIAAIDAALQKALVSP